jgi:hypothetical protein
MGLSYLAAAHRLAVDCHPAEGEATRRLSFDHPIHFLYSQALELIVKSLLLNQGHTPDSLKKIGHNLAKLYSKIDQKWIDRFDSNGTLRLACDHFGQLRLIQFYNYSSNNAPAEFSLQLIDRTLNVFRIEDAEIRSIFDESKIQVGAGVLKLMEEYSQS